MKHTEIERLDTYSSIDVLEMVMLSVLFLGGFHQGQQFQFHSVYTSR